MVACKRARAQFRFSFAFPLGLGSLSLSLSNGGPIRYPIRKIQKSDTSDVSWGVKIKADSDDCILFYGWGRGGRNVTGYMYMNIPLFLRCFDLVSTTVFIAVLLI